MTEEPKGRKNSKTSPSKIKLQEFKKKALELRKDGYSYDQIAEFMQEDYPDEHIYKQKVENWVRTALHEITKDTAAEALKLDLDRLDALLQAVFQNAQNGDLMSVSAVLNILDRRSRLYGLGALERLQLKKAKKEMQDDRALDDNKVTNVTIQIVDKSQSERVDKPIECEYPAGQVPSDGQEI